MSRLYPLYSLPHPFLKDWILHWILDWPWTHALLSTSWTHGVYNPSALAFTLLWPLPLSYCLPWNGRIGTDSFVQIGFPYPFLFWGFKHCSPRTCLKPEGHKRLPITRNEKGIDGESCYQLITSLITTWACYGMCFQEVTGFALPE